jgi:hypothetical protein
MNFEIVFNALFRVRVLELHTEAGAFGQDAAFSAAFSSLVGRLQDDPSTVGEVLFHLSQGEPVHHAVEAPVSLHFAIFEQDHSVWLFRINRLAAPQE